MNPITTVLTICALRQTLLFHKRSQQQYSMAESFTFSQPSVTISTSRCGLWSVSVLFYHCIWALSISTIDWVKNTCITSTRIPGRKKKQKTIVFGNHVSIELGLSQKWTLIPRTEKAPKCSPIMLRLTALIWEIKPRCGGLVSQEGPHGDTDMSLVFDPVLTWVSTHIMVKLNYTNWFKKYIYMSIKT